MAAKGVVQMMKRIKNILKMTLITTLVLTTFSGAVAVQAAGPRHDRPGWEQRDDRYRDHDRRDRMRAILKGWCPENEETAPQLCYAVERDDVRFLMMDSMSPGSHSGHVPEACAAWLERELARRPGVPALLFMHHPPFITGMGAMDEPYENVERLRAILEKLVAGCDLVMADLKHIDSQKHRAGTGHGNEQVLENLRSLTVPLILRTPIVPGFNDDAGTISRIAEFAVKLDMLQYYELLTYHPLGCGKAERLGLEERAKPQTPLTTDTTDSRKSNKSKTAGPASTGLFLSHFHEPMHFQGMHQNNTAGRRRNPSEAPPPSACIRRAAEGLRLGAQGLSGRVQRLGGCRCDPPVLALL